MTKHVRRNDFRRNGIRRNDHFPRSDVPYGHALMLLLGEGSEATEPYNKYDKLRPRSIRSLQFDQKVRPLSFQPVGFDLSTATRAAYILILLSEVEQEQRHSGNGDRDTIVVGAGLCDGEGERAYIAYARHYIFASRTHI